MHGLLNLFRLCRANRWQILWRLRVPSALPYFFGGLRIASGLALIGAVVAEFVAGTGGQGAGLAYQILLAGMQLNIPRLFAALFADRARRRRAVRGDRLRCRGSRSSRWHESEMRPTRSEPLHMTGARDGPLAGSLRPKLAG